MNEHHHMFWSSLLNLNIFFHFVCPFFVFEGLIFIFRESIQNCPSFHGIYKMD